MGYWTPRIFVAFVLYHMVWDLKETDTLGYVRDHFVYDQPFAVELVKGQEFGIVEVIHFDLDPGYGDGIGDLDPLDLSVEGFSGVLWALAIFDTIQVLGQCLVIGLSFDVAEEQGTVVIDGL